ncbi:polysaccharide biosynthesis tyrosine autokinase [Devosia nitrariae]|uniref:non-specific protein-tyrosine kinase n=1 Tax=Devosia nitrariae TaxID=2071872 RepID=A0ABQ5W187_9HYPH|nr:polysaccharide biosynthesis tyrosine autokinase [Devosia nitrariae]GLQ53662.1 chromosome partitioning protein ParA [Devosia nitrariae]
MQKTFRATYGASFSPPDEIGDKPLDLDALLAAARRQLWVTVSAVLAVLVLGVIHFLTSVPIYTASSRVLIDSADSRIIEELSAVGGVTDDEASILSQVELLKSEELALAVVDDLDLTTDPRLWMGSGSLLSDLRNFIVSLTSLFMAEAAIQGEGEADHRSEAAEHLASNLFVVRVGRTYVLEISYASPRPQFAAEIVNAYAEAYLGDQLDAKYEATRRASSWMQDRIAELRQQALESDLAVQNYRAEKGLITTGGELLSEQELSQIARQLVEARAETASADAQLRSIQAIIESGEMDAVVSDALSMPVISGMRERYLEASRQEADISARLGADHATAVRLRGEMQEYRRQMFGELSRIAESYRSTLEMARTRQTNLEQQVAEATGISTTANDDLVQLRELEREAETYNSLYQTFLERYQVAVQQQSFPVTAARIISRAETPKKPSSPRLPISLAISAGLGMILGGGLGALREFRDRFFRTADQVRDELGVEFLGFVPVLQNTLRGRQNLAVRSGHGNGKSLVKTQSITTHVVDRPSSLFAETMRSAKLAVDLMVEHKAPRVIGLVSVMSGEGKSTVSMNLAEYLAKQGARTLLIDGDLRSGACSRALAPDADCGLAEVLLGTAPVARAIYRDHDSDMMFLPTSAKRSVPYSAELLASHTMADLLAAAGNSFDYVVIDLPPLGPVVDARAIADKMDAFVLVVEWGKTPRRLVRSTLRFEHLIADKCVGVVLNKVDIKKLKLYDADGASPYYGGQHPYYHESD